MKNAFGRAAVTKAVLLVTGSTYVSLLFGLLSSALIARGIGPENFGRFSYVLWISGILVLIANNGLTTTALRFVSENLGKKQDKVASDVHGWLLRGQHLALLATALVFIATAELSRPLDWNMSASVFLLVVLASVVTKAYAIFEVSVAKGHGQFSVDAVSSTLMTAFSLLVTLGLFLMRAPTIAYLVLFVFANTLYFLVARRMIRVRGIAATSAPLEAELNTRIRSHLGWTIVLTLAAAFSNRASETYLLGKYFGAAEVGFFAIAAAFTRGGMDLLVVGVNAVLMPLMAHGYGEGGATRVHAILSNSVRFFTFGGLLLAGVGFMWADVVVTLMYGSEYHEAVNVLRVMILVAGVTLSQGGFGALLSTTDNQIIRAGVAIASALVSAAAAFLLVPRFGLNGAILSFAISSLVIYMVVCVGVIRVFGVKLPWRELSRLMLAAGVAALASGALLLLGQELLVQFAAGLLFALVYLSGTVFFRAWREEDYAQLHPLAKRFPKLLGRVLSMLERWAAR
jgi:O-antigen/teichoic acid export membrane protein